MIFNPVVGLQVWLKLQISQVFNGDILNISKLVQMLFSKLDDDLDLVELFEMAHLAAQFINDPLYEFDLGFEGQLLLLHV